MKKFRKMVDHIAEELDGATEYAEDYIGEKMKGNAAKAQKFREMAMQEMQHATNWYDWTEKYGEELKTIMPLSAEDTEDWEACKRKYADKTAMLKYMLDR